jgi:hypothetical protein
MRLMESLAGQLNATLEISGGDGVRISLTWRAKGAWRSEGDGYHVAPTDLHAGIEKDPAGGGALW